MNRPTSEWATEKARLLKFYVNAIERHHLLFDEIVAHCITGDYAELLEFAGNQMNDNDAVDDERIEQFDKAKRAVLERRRARDDAIIDATIGHLLAGIPGPIDHDRIIAAAEEETPT